MLASLTFDDIHPSAINIDTLKRIFDLLKRYKLKSTIFVTPLYLDKKISENREYVNLLKNYLEEGNEIAIHGFRHENYEFGYPLIPFPLFDDQIKKLEKSVKIFEKTFHIKANGFRSPNYHHNNNTIKALNKLKFIYDSSKTVFKPARMSKIRFRTFVPLHPYMIYNNLVEIPITGDYLFNIDSRNFDDSIKYMKKDIEYIRKSNGVIVINNHLQLQHLLVDYEQFLKTLIRINGLNFDRLDNIAKNTIN